MAAPIKIPSEVEDTESLTRRCPKDTINLEEKRINANAFYHGYPMVSVDRERYRSIKETLSVISNASFFAARGIAWNIRQINGIQEVISSPSKRNKAHAEIVIENNSPKSKSELFKMKTCLELAKTFELIDVSDLY